MCPRSRSPRSSRSRSGGRPGSPKPSSEVAKKMEDLKKRVRALPRGGDLEVLIHEGALEVVEILARELVEERRHQQGASSEASFSPSGLPVLLGGDRDASGG